MSTNYITNPDNGYTHAVVGEENLVYAEYDDIKKQCIFHNLDGKWHPCASVEAFKRICEQDLDGWEDPPNGKDCQSEEQ